MKNKILTAASQVLIHRGLNAWTVDEVARRARCAKGLVNYHYRSKQALLERVAQFLRDQRWSERREAARGENPLDRLWQTVIDEVNSGRFAAWLSLMAGGGPLRSAAAGTGEQAAELSRTLGRALGLGEELVPRKELIAAALDGLGLQILQGGDPGRLEETYHRFWMTVVAEDQGPGTGDQ
jgi:AcrR family transcriptional regulator